MTSLESLPLPEFEPIETLMDEADRLLFCHPTEGKTAKIMALLNRVIASGAGSADDEERRVDARWWRGQMYFNDGEYAKAVNDFDVVIAASGENHTFAFAMRAVAHALLKNTALAAADVATLQRIDPRDHWFHTYCEKLLDRNDAEALDLAILLQPRDAYHYFRRAAHRRAIGDSEGAQSDSAEWWQLRNGE